MVWYRIVDAVSGPPQLPKDQPTKLPSYFPVQPKGCESPAQVLFQCLLEDATPRARDMEKAGFHSSYFSDVTVKSNEEQQTAAQIARNHPEDFPQPGENPLDVCRTQIAYYQRCCDRELSKRKNWMLTEPFRVQEEYRYQGPSTSPKSSTSSSNQ